MKSDEMFEKVLDRAVINGIAWHQGQADLKREQDLALGDFKRGAASRNAEVAELKSEVNRLVNDVRELVDQVGDLSVKLRDKQLDSFNEGVKAGRTSEVTRETVKVMSDTAARAIFSAIRIGG